MGAEKELHRLHSGIGRLEAEKISKMQKRIDNALKRHGFRFTHSLGQNFILSEQILQRIVDLSGITGADCVMEIGAGAGTLTYFLCQKAKKVLAFEIDRALLPVLGEVLSPFGNVRIVGEDVMKADLAALTREAFGAVPFCVVANLPYYITTPVLMLLLESDLPIGSITVMVQKEVAQRITAEAGCKDYGALTLAVQYRMEAQIVLEVPAQAFTPPPKVDSAVILLKRRREAPVALISEELFFKTVKAAFAMRRKTMANNLCASFGLCKEDMKNLLEASGLNPAIRGEALDMQQMAGLSNALAKIFHAGSGC